MEPKRPSNEILGEREMMKDFWPWKWQWNNGTGNKKKKKRNWIHQGVWWGLRRFSAVSWRSSSIFQLVTVKWSVERVHQLASFNSLPSSSLWPSSSSSSSSSSSWNFPSIFYFGFLEKWKAERREYLRKEDPFESAMQIGLAQWIFPHLKHRWNSNKMIRCIVEYFNIVCVFFFNFPAIFFLWVWKRGGGRGGGRKEREEAISPVNWFDCNEDDQGGRFSISLSLSFSFDLIWFDLIYFFWGGGGGGGALAPPLWPLTSNFIISFLHIS